MEKAVDLEKFALLPGQYIPDGQKPCPDGTICVLYILTYVKKFTCYQIKYRKIISKCHCETFKVIIESHFQEEAKKEERGREEKEHRRENWRKKDREGRKKEEMRGDQREKSETKFKFT